jgi:hypothetical protein
LLLVSDFLFAFLSTVCQFQHMDNPIPSQ